ncbi:hypothetical protein PR003_g8076 [Phytophthora rubi]|uniref:RxLR effector protein n=1 Tax=Phytophthora rubi TaxID=129364 RepID=A0A6A3KZN7_9STRA|nr:hypothetical protein PR002_g14861 [Phytophthora rubi]KAE9345162.1 hypothetical protein PR003_g8076 [Phytophthora rubi]
MRPKSIVLLIAAALLACVDSASSATASKSTTVALPHSFAENQEIISAKRFLRTSKAANEDDEERAGIEAITGVIKAGASKVVDTTKLNSWLLRNKDGVQVLSKLKLGDDIASALENKKLDTLSKYITMYNEKHPTSKISLIGTLTAHYGDDVLAKALVSAQKNANTEALASQLRTKQLAAWLKNDKSVVDVFKLLNLGDDGYLALTSRKLEVLEDYRQRR